MLSFSGKGLLGLRMDAVFDVEIRNIYVYNLYEYTPLGNTFGGEYDGNSGTDILQKDDEESPLTAPGSGGIFDKLHQSKQDLAVMMYKE